MNPRIDVTLTVGAAYVYRPSQDRPGIDYNTYMYS